jgi:hypothetical protein
MTSAAQMQLPFEDDGATAANDNRPPRNRWEREFRVFHAKNPHVYDLVRAFTFDAIKSGRDHYAINDVISRIRWHTQIETRDDTFKINSNFAPYYARLFMADHPEHRGFFRNRKILGE